MIVRIPLKCPRCGGAMHSVSYDAPLRLLRHRSWQCCRDCGMIRDTDEFKRGLFTV